MHTGEPVSFHAETDHGVAFARPHGGMDELQARLFRGESGVHAHVFRLFPASENHPEELLLELEKRLLGYVRALDCLVHDFNRSSHMISSPATLPAR